MWNILNPAKTYASCDFWLREGKNCLVETLGSWPIVGLLV